MLSLAAKDTVIINSSECLVALVFAIIANILLPSKQERSAGLEPIAYGFVWPQIDFLGTKILPVLFSPLPL